MPSRFQRSQFQKTEFETFQLPGGQNCILVSGPVTIYQPCDCTSFLYIFLQAGREEAYRMLLDSNALLIKLHTKLSYSRRMPTATKWRELILDCACTIDQTKQSITDVNINPCVVSYILVLCLHGTGSLALLRYILGTRCFSASKSSP